MNDELTTPLLRCDVETQQLASQGNYVAQGVPNMRNRHSRRRGLRVHGQTASSEEVRRRINDVNRRDDLGNTALWFAVKHRDQKSIEILLLEKADPNTQNKEGDTPCHLAARTRDFDIIDLLYKNDADLSIRNNAGHDVLSVGEMSDRTATGRNADFLTKLRSLERRQRKDRQFVAACGNERVPSWMRLAGEERDYGRPLVTNFALIES